MLFGQVRRAVFFSDGVGKISGKHDSANLRTRKLSCRKDDRAMRPLYGCPENFWSP